MKIDHFFISINAADYAAQTEWWAKLIGRRWDSEPVLSCHEWDLTDHVWFQVLDRTEGLCCSKCYQRSDIKPRQVQTGL